MKVIGRYLLSVLGVVICLTSTELKASSPTAHYWIDHNRLVEGTSQLNDNQLSMDIDVSGYPGAHTLYYRIQDEEGKWSVVTCIPFISNPQRSGGDAKSCEYWIDKNISQLKKVAAPDNVISFDLDCKDLAPGAHELYYHVEDQFGNFGSTSCALFIRTPNSGGDAKSCEYWIDKNIDQLQKIAATDNITFFNIDCDGLDPGPHGLYYRVEDQFGNFGSPICHVFYKNPAEGSHVAWYRYWWNDRYDLAEEVTVSTDSPIFMLDSDLTIPDYAADKDNDSHAAHLYMIFGDDTGNISEVLDVKVNYELYLAGINDLTSEVTWGYRTNGNNLTLSGLTPGKGILRIFSLDGRQIHAEIPDEDSVIHTIEMEKIVIVCYDGASKKIILR